MKKNVISTVSCLVLCIVLGNVNVCSAQTGAFANHYDAAQNYLMQNQYSSSIVEFRKAMRINYLDNSARIGLINAYLARATYYANQEKNFEKAANDFRSAIFYLKIYPTGDVSEQNSPGVVASAIENLNQCLKVLSYDTTAGARYKKAEELRASGNFSAAAFEFSKAAQNEKLAADSNMQIADLLKLLGNEAKSVDYYDMALKLNPNNGLLRMKYARTLDRLGKYDEAVTQYNEALANSKGDMEVLYALERIYLKKLVLTPSDAELNANIGAIKQAQGDFDAALSYYGKAEKLNPSNVTTRLNVGTLFQQKKDYSRAIQSYDSVLTLYPDHVQALMYKAQIYKELGDNKKAIDLYQRVLKVEPANSQAKDDLAVIMKDSLSPDEYIAYLVEQGRSNDLYDYGYKLHKENKFREAISAYNSFIEKDNTNVDAYVNLAICYASLEDYKNSLKVLNTAKNLFPTNNLVLKTIKTVENDYSAIRLSSASTSYESQDFQKAIQQYMAIQPATEASLLGIAASYQGLGDYRSAIEYYKKAQKLNPNNLEISYYIGALYSELNNWTLAEQYLSKAKDSTSRDKVSELLAYVNQNGSISILNEGIELFDANKSDEAMLKFTEALRKDSNNLVAYYYRGLIYDSQKQYKSAIDDFLKVVNNAKDYPLVGYMLAVDYDNLSNYKDAYKYYNTFASTYKTDDEYLRYAKARMEELKQYAG